MCAKKFSMILALSLFAFPVRAEQIKIAYSGVSAAGTPLWLAKEEGVFSRHGLEADLVAVRSAPLQVTALVSNEVQFVRGSASSMLTAAAQGAKLKILFSLFAERASYDFLQKERGLAVLQKHIKTDRQLAEIGYKNLLEDLTPYTFVTVKGLKTVQEIIALRDPKIAKFNVEDLLDQRILKKVAQSGYVEEIERRYKIRP
jgi:ABC-type nitrate/sulfonate/bicarbonate transport system substrate-binding protein